MRKILKRSRTINLSSKNINNIFYPLKKGASFEEIKENFLFELNVSEDFLVYNIKVPNHQKYLHFNNEYESFKELFFYLEKNKKDPLLIPFLGDDLIEKTEKKRKKK